MTHHVVTVERTATPGLNPSGYGWRCTVPSLTGTVMEVSRLCDVEDHVRYELQRRHGDITGDTIEVRIGTRRPDPAPPTGNTVPKGKAWSGGRNGKVTRGAYRSGQR